MDPQRQAPVRAGGVSADCTQGIFAIYRAERRSTTVSGDNIHDMQGRLK